MRKQAMRAAGGLAAGLLILLASCDLRVLNPGAISPDGKLLALPHNLNLEVISVETGETRQIAGPDPGEVYGVKWLPDGETLVSYEYHGDLPWELRRYGKASESHEVWLRNIVTNTSRRL